MEKEPKSNLAGELFSGLLGVWGEMWDAFWEVFPKMVSFILWALLAIVVLPCVYIAGNIYPLWVEWGEKL